MSFAALLAQSDAMLEVLPEPEDTRSHVDVILSRFDEVDARLVAAGFPPTSPWWRRTIERWYRSGKRRAVLRCGRRAGKSSTLSRLAVVEAVYGKHDVPPGDVGFVAIISTDRNEALGRLRTVEAVLDALGVAYRPCGGGIVGIELQGRRTGFRVFTATIKGVSGFTAIFVLCDEVAKWADADTGANPAAEVLASVRPTMKTQPNARMAMSSSPMSTMDAHERGVIFGQHVFYKALKRAAAEVLGPVRGKDFAPYDFRHGRAKERLDVGAKIRGVSWMLGHKRASTTDKYLAPDRAAGREAVQAGPSKSPSKRTINTPGRKKK